MGALFPRHRHVDGHVDPRASLLLPPICGVCFGASVCICRSHRSHFRPGIVGGGSQVLGLSPQYDVAADGRFLVNVTAEESVTPPITLLLNWARGNRSSRSV
jgi:hypothetical protein